MSHKDIVWFDLEDMIHTTESKTGAEVALGISYFSAHGGNTEKNTENELSKEMNTLTMQICRLNGIDIPYDPGSGSLGEWFALFGKDDNFFAPLRPFTKEEKKLLPELNHQILSVVQRLLILRPGQSSDELGKRYDPMDKNTLNSMDPKLPLFEKEFSYLYALLNSAKHYEWEFHRVFAEKHGIKPHDVHTTLDELMDDEIFGGEHLFQEHTLGQVIKESSLYTNIERLYSHIIQAADYQLFMLENGYMRPPHPSTSPFDKYATFNLVFVPEKTKTILKKNAKVKYRAKKYYISIDSCGIGVCHEYVRNIFYDRLNFFERTD